MSKKAYSLCYQLLPAGLLAVSTVAAEIAENDLLTWIFYTLAAASLVFLSGKMRRIYLLAFIGTAILLTAPITTDATRVSLGLAMFGWLALGVAAPLVIDRYILKTKTLGFNKSLLKPKQRLYASIGVAIMVILTYLTLQPYLIETGSYLNWTVANTSESFWYLVVGALFVGAWDELFFINTLLPVFKRNLPFWLANACAGVIFTSFLWAIGFRSWGLALLYPFALMQGYIYQKTRSLWLVVTTHLLLDLILVAALINAYYPNQLDIFL